MLNTEGGWWPQNVDARPVLEVSKYYCMGQDWNNSRKSAHGVGGADEK